MIARSKPIRSIANAWIAGERAICSRTHLNKLEVRVIGGFFLAAMMMAGIVWMAAQCAGGAC